ncbi:unnamed protein product [Mytilus coruscus]|uniref:Uncharacterized protein n=1 Tax=Mytilus coruscus TaxID=42192 RepID=A0A6J8C5K4_MYTCO|nr:unnamed protein product [Mytilus coruscus]
MAVVLNGKSIPSQLIGGRVHSLLEVLLNTHVLNSCMFITVGVIPPPDDLNENVGNSRQQYVVNVFHGYERHVKIKKGFYLGYAEPVNEIIDDISSIRETLNIRQVHLPQVSNYGQEDYTSETRQVYDDGVYTQYFHHPISAGPNSPAPSIVTASCSAGIESKLITTIRSRPHQCFVCGLVTHGKMRRHVLKTHLPWNWEPHTTCWSCVQEAQAGSVAHRHTMEHGVEGTVFDEDHMHL